MDISLLLQSEDDDASSLRRWPVYERYISSEVTAQSTRSTTSTSGSSKSSYTPTASQSSSTVSRTVARKQSKWSAEEDAQIVRLRGEGMKWEDISKIVVGRSAISCRLHYQNYLEKSNEWDDDTKNQFAWLYERFKSEMWAKIAREMAIPWRLAEAMHWQIGEREMAGRAGATPFILRSIGS